MNNINNINTPFTPRQLRRYARNQPLNGLGHMPIQTLLNELNVSVQNNQAFKLYTLSSIIHLITRYRKTYTQNSHKFSIGFILPDRHGVIPFREALALKGNYKNLYDSFTYMCIIDDSSARTINVIERIPTNDPKINNYKLKSFSGKYMIIDIINMILRIRPTFSSFGKKNKKNEKNKVNLLTLKRDLKIIPKF